MSARYKICLRFRRIKDKKKEKFIDAILEMYEFLFKGFRDKKGEKNTFQRILLKNLNQQEYFSYFHWLISDEDKTL